MNSRTAKAVVAATLTAAGLSVSLASPAAAAVNGCTTAKYGNNGSMAYCIASAPGSQFRAAAYCKYLTPTGSEDHNFFYGAWRKQGDEIYSSVVCGAGWIYLSPDVQTK
ncbi:hypothetical protein [Amycolatopsis sp. NPDC049159]|uniref:hypothetical protein n=1 Tax=Amycolatopsis sp. NPDC049159 TaxID=3157210 RepID=UPI0033C64467